MRLRVLLACLLVPLLVWGAVPMLSSGQQPLQERIEKAREKIGRKKGTERLLTSDIQAYTRRIRRLQGRIGGLQRRQATIQADLDAKRAELVQIQGRLRSERARLVRLRARLRVTKRVLARRLGEMYKADRPDILSVVLNSDGFADMLERGEFIRRIADQDRRIVVVVRAAKKDATQTAARLDRLERRQQRVTAIVLSRRNEVAMIKQELIGTRVGYENTKEGKARALANVREDRKELEDHVDGLEAEQAKVQARLASANGTRAPGPIKQGSGQLIWPADGVVSSPFGQRWGRLHAGIDVPLSVGTPLRAADGGKVVIAGFTGGYGNYTCIQHTGSMSTCYAHQSSIGTTVGSTVSKGQVIGQSGNTGNSTGPHLHFEVRINGSPVDPMGYL
jgi:murein DD-endopeptidase MepM/ murein hydrolase activator NlpD